MVRRSITVIADEFLSPPTAESSSPTLVERLGDTAHIARIVDRYIERVLNDPELAPRFVGIDMVPLKKSQISFLTAAFGGPDQLELGHAPVDLDDEQFGRFVLHLYESLLSFGLSDSFTEQLVLAVMTRALSGDTATEPKAGFRELLQHAR
jgi:hemoglobin